MSKQSLLWPTLSSLCGIAILCALGFWQLQRLEWKINLENELDKEFTRDISEMTIKPSDIDGNYMFKRGTLSGTYDFETQIYISPRVYKNLPGRHVYTLLRLKDGSNILVNRGWVPNGWSFDRETPEKRAALQTDAIQGVLRTPEHNPFSPENKPEKEQWYFAEPALLAKIKTIPKMHDRVLVLEGQGPESEYPIPTNGKPVLENNHLQYAIFWFVMAGILFIMYILRFLRKR